MVKKPATKKKTEELDLSEWILPTKHTGRSVYTLCYKYTKLNDKKAEFSLIFTQEVSDHLGVFKKDRIHVAHHRDNPKRILVFPSDNGYSINQPDPSKLYFYTKLRCDVSAFNTDYGKFIVEPVYRKNRAIEFMLK